MKIKKAKTVYWLTGCLIFQGISAIGGSIALLSGILKMPLSYLDGSPFNDYRIPGIILFTVLGIYPMIITAGLLKQKLWAYPAAKVMGSALIIWIITEIDIVGYRAETPLQLMYGLLGVIILVLAYFPAVQSS